MKKHQVHMPQDPPAIQLKPIISYPRTAQAGELYLLTIDLQLAPDSPWPYQEEEFEVSFLLETAPFFSYEPLGEDEPGLVLHRFGSTYGAAEYLLTASAQEVPAGHIKITLLNGWGLPITQLKLECEVKQNVSVTDQKQVVIREKKETPLTTTRIPSVEQVSTFTENSVAHDMIAKQLSLVGWNLQIADEPKQESNMPHVFIPVNNAAVQGLPSFENDYLLFIDGEPIGIVKVYPKSENFLNIDKNITRTIRRRGWGVIVTSRNKKRSRNLYETSFVYHTAGNSTVFQNYLEPQASPREVYTFHQPATLALWLKQSQTKVLDKSNTPFRANLRKMPALEKRDLFDYQVEALQHIEQSLFNYESRILIQMEIGRGKTYLAINSIYRLLKHANAKCIFYVVSSSLIKKQVLEAFQHFIVPEDDQAPTSLHFTDLYDVRLIGNEVLDPSAHVYIGTLGELYDLYAEGWMGECLPEPASNDNSMYFRSFFEGYCTKLPIEFFDVIFLAEGEGINYRVWQPILDYFDAFLIGIVSVASDDVLHFFKNNIVYPVTDAGSVRQLQLSSVINHARYLLHSATEHLHDIDRLPQLVWLLYLKNLDDYEEVLEELDDDYMPIIEKPFRWRDWVVTENPFHRRTGNELLTFVNNDLIPYLAHLHGSDRRDIRSITGTIFQNITNRIHPGDILREIVDRFSTINFNASDDILAISRLYETMLKEMYDSAGDAGEFYTPRPVVRFIIDRLQPQLGESILDPACGTAGFLVEAYNRLQPAVKTPEQRKQLEDNLRGIEKRPMTYLLAVMNMLLHGIIKPDLIQSNTLTTDIRQFQDRDAIDIIASNPPFGGEEKLNTITHFSEDTPTTETSLLFIQYIMAVLKRPNGRCGVVLPNGFLFGNGIAAIIKKKLLTQFNLHTIVRLPQGVFSPYTSIPTNILFFEAGEDLYHSENNSCTKEIWYYEIPLPKGRKSFTKTNPIQDEAFRDCLSWWDQRSENAHAWKVSIEQVQAHDYNLDWKNPQQ